MSWSHSEWADGLQRVLSFLAELERMRAPYELAVNREDALMVLVATPGERWEIEFLADGDIEIERFRSDGQIAGPEALDDLWALLRE